MQIVAFPLIRLAIRSTPCPQFGIVVFEQIIVQILVASLNQPPRATALRQARVSGGNLQNCAPSAACGGAYASALFCHWQGRYSGSRLGEGFYGCAVSPCLAVLANNRNQPCPLPAPNHRPRGSGQRSWTQGWRSQTGGEKCRDAWAELAPDQAAQIFHCRGARTQPTLPTSIFIQSAFMAATQVLWYFLDARKYRTPRTPRIPVPSSSAPTPPPCGRDWLPWCECSAGTPPDRPPACRPQSAA